MVTQAPNGRQQEEQQETAAVRAKAHRDILCALPRFRRVGGSSEPGPEAGGWDGVPVGQAGDPV